MLVKPSGSKKVLLFQNTSALKTSGQTSGPPALFRGANISRVTVMMLVGALNCLSFCLPTSSASVVRKTQGDPVSALRAVLRQRVGLSQSRPQKHGCAHVSVSCRCLSSCAATYDSPICLCVFRTSIFPFHHDSGCANTVINK